MATTDERPFIWIQIADLAPFRVNLKDKSEEKTYRDAEKMLNTVWNRYVARFRGTRPNESIMAMVAFRFAWNVVAANAKNEAVANFLKEFERQLDEIVVKI